MDSPNTLVLEVFKSQNVLKMSVSEERELAKTVSHYSQCTVSFDDVSKLCQEVSTLLKNSNQKSARDHDAIARLKKAGQLLWEQLLTRPVKDRLKITIIKDLVLSLEEELVSIPWELFYDGNDFLGLKFNVGRLIRSQHQESQPHYRSLTGKLRMLILANPTNDLRSAYEEGINIRNQFDKARDRIAIDFKSTSIDTLYVKKSLREYDIVHFAGHCEYEKENPQDTGWVLSDGRFTTQDILSIGQDAVLPSLVFSNACQSAQVDQEAMSELDSQQKSYSLASAFLFAGVRHYIGAVHRIEDPVSFSFAKEFYTQLLRGKSVGESVRIGRLRLIKEYGLEAILWASYILYGDPNFVLFQTKAKPPRPELKSTTATFYRIHKRPLVGIVLAVVGIAVAISLALWLPSVNPTDYYLVKKAQRLYKNGHNTDVIKALSGILERDHKFLEAYPLLADTYFRLGKRDDALKYYFDYLLKSQEKNDQRHLADAYNLIGWLYHQNGQYPKAFEFYDKAITTSRQNKDKLHEAIAMRKLAVWYMDKEENDKALELLTKSSEINRERDFDPDHRYNLACDYFDLGLLFTNKGDFATAKEFYNKSRTVLTQLNFKNEMSDYYFNLGEICLNEKHYQLALEYYLKGLTIDQVQGNKPSLASDYIMLGELWMEMDNLSKAQEYFQKAEALAKQIDAPMELAQANHNLGLVFLKNNQKNKAREYLRIAEEIYRGIDTPAYKEVQSDLLSLDGAH